MPPIPRIAVQRAALHDGAIDTAGLRAAGLDRGAVDHWLEIGWMRRLHRGVFQLGPVGGPSLHEHAALMSCGPRSVVSCRSAAAVRRMLPRSDGPVEVTVTGGHRRSRPGIAVRHAALASGDVELVGRLRVTSPLRTLLDLAVVATDRELEVAVNEAQVLGLVRPTELRRVVARSRHRGVTRLRRLLDEAAPPTRSELERRMRALVRRVGLPIPRTQVRLLRYTVDFLWPDERVVVEVDGFAAHGTRMRFESDRERDAALVAAGYRVLRFTWRQLVEQPEVVAARLAVVLARAAA